MEKYGLPDSKLKDSVVGGQNSGLEYEKFEVGIIITPLVLVAEGKQEHKIRPVSKR